MINILHFGDITQIDGHKVPIVDVITGGSPCQDLSVAGLRKGLEGERSGLFMEQMRIVKEMRNECRKQQSINGAVSTVSGINPRYLVWENVCGAFSSGSPAGADFQAVLEEIVRVVTDKAPSVPIPEDGWSYAGNLEGMGDDGTPFSICWRTVDAQYWGKSVIDNSGRVVKRGTPQRRRRISLVADFGGNTAPEILFERTSVSRDSESSRKEGQETPGTTGTSIEKSGTNGITAICIGNGQVDNAVTPEDDKCQTLNAYNGTGGNNTPFAVENSQVSTDEPTVYEWYRRDTRATELGDVCSTVQASYGSGGNNMPYVVQKEPILLESNQNHATVQTDGVSTALPASMGEGGGYVPMVVEESTCPVKQEGCDVYNHEVTGEVAVTVTPDCGGTNTIDPKVLMYNDVITCTKQLTTTNNNVSSALEATDYKQAQTICYGFEPGVTQRLDPENRFSEEIAPTLRANAGDNQTAVVYGISALDSMGMKSSNPHSGVYKADTSRSLDLNGGNPACNQGGMMVVQLTADKPAKESVKTYGVTAKGNGDTFIAEGRHTALSTGGEPGQENHSNPTKLIRPVVRRLTPVECERLMGFPDNWTLLGDWIDTNGKKHKDSDSARYKALGNSICLPYWNWLAGRMCDQLRKSGVENPTMASLFDGISGFPLVYVQHGCIPMWSSEIEEFPIAVAKKHFGDDETGEKGDYEQYLNQGTIATSSNTPDVCYGLDRASFNQGKNAKYDFSIENDLAQTLVSRGPGGIMVKSSDYKESI